MEVMNSTEFEQKDVLVGSSGKTGKFTVNDDPHLMSMLSTSLYANPLRTMIQEIMFNAWDAHRMGNCQDRPIDIYLNNTTGLIVRDYGPGIPPEMIDEIYCTYGASTKRDDSNQTGGFGLGSKSPYAYNDNFMVANHHKGLKNMYIMRRVHDDNDGGPGYDHIIENIPTEETGLMVTVSLKNESDLRRAYEYLKDILFLSGVKVNIHYDGLDKEIETVEAQSLAPAEFINKQNGNNKIWAVYGGVKYEIPYHEEYGTEYLFLQGIGQKLGSLYIGFAPNTLTPLPNREGLNMRERSIESVKNHLETIHEYFMSQMIPAIKMAMIESFRSMKSSELQPQFLIYQWNRVGIINLNQVIFEEDDVPGRINLRCPDSMNSYIWASIVSLVMDQTRFISGMVGSHKFDSIKSLIWAKELPEYKHWRYHIYKAGGVEKQNIVSEYSTDYSSWLIDTQRKIEAITDTEQKPRVKVNENQNWSVLTNQRRAGRTNHIKAFHKINEINNMTRKGLLKIPQKLYDDKLWFQKDGEAFTNPMKKGIVILAKTTAALSSTQFNFQEMMIPRHPKIYGYDQWTWHQWAYDASVRPVAAFIVHKKKGNYDAVKAMLEAEGIEVIEADEPEVKTTTSSNGGITSTPKTTSSLHVLDVQSSNWEGNEEVKKPSTFLYCTKTDLNGYYNPYHAGFVSLVQQYVPKMAMVHNKTKAKKLEKDGAVSFEDRVELIVDKLISNEERLRALTLHILVHEDSGLPMKYWQSPRCKRSWGFLISERNRLKLSSEIVTSLKSSLIQRIHIVTVIVIGIVMIPKA